MGRVRSDPSQRMGRPKNQSGWLNLHLFWRLRSLPWQWPLLLNYNFVHSWLTDSLWLLWKTCIEIAFTIVIVVVVVIAAIVVVWPNCCMDGFPYISYIRQTAREHVGWTRLVLPQLGSGHSKEWTLDRDARAGIRWVRSWRMAAASCDRCRSGIRAEKTDNVNPNQSSAGGTDLSVALRNFNTYQNQSLTAYSRPKF